MPKILFNLASRERPYKFFNCLDNIISMARHDDYLISATLDIDDKTMNNRQVKMRIDAYGDRVVAFYGTSKNKIDAINKNVSLHDDVDIILNHSDDFWFFQEGFDLDILEAFKDWDGLVHFPDQVAGERLITYAMMSKAYYDLDGWIYHPDFCSVYADNFQQDLAKHRGKYKFVNKRIMDHQHSIWGWGPPDELLKRTEDPVVYERDRLTYFRLKTETFLIK